MDSDYRTPRSRSKAGYIAAVIAAVLAVVAAVAVLRPSGTEAEAAPAAATSSEWELVEFPRGKGWIPVGGPGGPSVTTPFEWSGWPRTPEGAVAAAHTIFSGAFMEQQQGVAYMREHVAPPWADLDYALLALPDEPQLPADEAVTPTGWRVADYTGDTARVTVAYKKPSNVPFVPQTTFNMIWQDGQWKMVWKGTGPASTEKAGQFSPWGPADDA